MVVARKARDEYRKGYVSEPMFLDTSECYVQQHDSAACDINNIMARYVRDGVIEHVKEFGAQYGDFTCVPDYATCLRAVSEAEECFNALPAKVRSRFENDPAQFLDFVSDPANRNEMALMGLLKDSPTEGEGVANERVSEAENAP